MQAMWVHGNNAQIELNHRGRGGGEDVGGIQWSAIEGKRIGGGVEYRCQDDSDYWFHFAIPTPVIDDGVRARLRRTGVLFRAGTGVTMSALHVWDGPTQVFVRDGLAIGGENLSIVEGRNWFPLPDREVLWGIGISVLFHFADPGNVTLVSAGVDFES